MKRLLIAGALTMMAAAGVASADDYRNDRREAVREYQQDQRKAEREYWKHRAEAERDYRKGSRKAAKEQAKAQRRWARGQHLPREYMAAPYYVRDYRAYELAAPPAGYTWVRPDPRDDQYYLVQLATGLISQILGR